MFKKFALAMMMVLFLTPLSMAEFPSDVTILDKSAIVKLIMISSLIPMRKRWWKLKPTVPFTPPPVLVPKNSKTIKPC